VKWFRYVFFYASPFVIEFRSSVRRISAVTRVWPVQSSHRLLERLTSPPTRGSYNKLRLDRRHPSEAVPVWYFHASPFVIEFRSSVRRISAVTRVWPVQSSHRLLERLTLPPTQGSYNKLRLGRRHPSQAVPLWYFLCQPYRY
jgi:hypothetical protein